MRSPTRSILSLLATGAAAVTIACPVGAAQFAPPVLLPVDGGPIEVLAGPFDAGQTIDLVAANESGELGQSLSLLRNAGSAAFDPDIRTSLPEEQQLRAAAAGDVTGDGRLDVAVAVRTSLTSAALVVFGDGDADGFTVLNELPLAGRAPLSVAVADLNQDQRLDILVGDSSQTGRGQIEILLALPDGDFSEPTAVTSGPSPGRLFVGDFDLDGEQDISIWDSALLRAQILFGEGNGAFTAPQKLAGLDGVDALTPVPTAASSLAEFFVILDEGSRLAWLRQSAPRQFVVAGSTVVGGDANALVGADFDGDGIPDAAVSHSATETIRIWKGTRNRLFTAGEAVEVSEPPIRLVAADLDGNRQPDLAAALQAADSILVLKNAAVPPTTPTTSPTTAVPAGTATRTPTATATMTDQPPPRTPTPSRTFTPTRSVTPLPEGDLDCDGRLDNSPVDAVVHSMFSQDCEAADTNHDGSVTVADIVWILQEIRGDE